MASSVMQEKARQRDHRQISQSGTVSRLLETLWMRNQSPENLGNEMIHFGWPHSICGLTMCQNCANFQAYRLIIKAGRGQTEIEA